MYMADDIVAIVINIKTMMSIPQLSEDDVHIKVVAFGLKLGSCIQFL